MTQEKGYFTVIDGWEKKNSFTLGEAVCLLMGMDPRFLFYRYVSNSFEILESPVHLHRNDYQIYYKAPSDRHTEIVSAANRILSELIDSVNTDQLPTQRNLEYREDKFWDAYKVSLPDLQKWIKKDGKDLLTELAKDGIMPASFLNQQIEIGEDLVKSAWLN